MRLLVSALEPSSNLHLREVLKQTSDIELLGIFDKSLGTPLYNIDDMAIMGVVDVVKKLFWFFRVLDEMVKLADGADKILLMDSSGFNIRLAKRLRGRYPYKEIIYYILPQVWASRPKRAKRLELYCDRLLAILPFEVNYYEGKAEYIGHPLLDEIEVKNGAKKGKIAFLAGSRRGEIVRLMPIFREVRAKLLDKRAILVIPSSFSDERIAHLYGDVSEFEISRDTHQALAEVEFAFICSGTATLESALIGTPFVLVYIAKRLDYFIASKLLNIPYVGLANILLNASNSSTLHTELLQAEVTVENLLNEYYTFDREIFTQKADELKRYLKHGSSQNVAKILMEE